MELNYIHIFLIYQMMLIVFLLIQILCIYYFHISVHLLHFLLLTNLLNNHIFLYVIELMMVEVFLFLNLVFLINHMNYFLYNRQMSLLQLLRSLPLLFHFLLLDIYHYSF